MKKILSMGIMMLITFTSCTQAAATHALQKGTKKVYVTEATIKVLEHETVNMSVEQQYKVVDETAEGYVLDIMVRDIQENKTTPPGLSVSAALSIMEGKHCQYATDKEGRVLRSLSINEVKEKYKKDYFSARDFIPGENDSTAQKLMSEMTEKKDLESLRATISPLALNGKDITDGTEEEYTDKNGLKMKRTYHVKSNGSIQSNATLNMKAEDIRAFYQNMLKQAGINLPKEAQQTLDEMVRNFRVEYTEEATYTFLPDGWVKTIDCVITQKMSEQEPITMTYKVYVK
ncbi:MAG: hypothetical protein K5672_00675 [Bacteroidaceae bacterium]|nr:hypothetical protein [Bacteroidaceae bacterium]